MSARRIAREIAVTVMSQLPKDRQKLEQLDLETLVVKSVLMLVDHAKQNLADADAQLIRTTQFVNNLELEHHDNAENIDHLHPVPVTTGQLKELVQHLKYALNLISEALDIPDMSLYCGALTVNLSCRKCNSTNEAIVQRHQKSDVLSFVHTLINAYLDHKEQIDQFIKGAKAKWQIERMVSIDRDILRLACAEAFYVSEVPINACISEAVELSHRFADEKAAKFINGVLADLASVAKHFRRTGSLPEADEVSDNVVVENADNENLSPYSA